MNPIPLLVTGFQKRKIFNKISTLLVHITEQDFKRSLATPLVTQKPFVTNIYTTHPNLGVLKDWMRSDH